jgi:beta-lactamase regulating signal transducer with metallopeptidase domain/uncharacterized membrane protein YkoI
MTSLSRAVLFLLLNAAWQVSLIGLLALATDRILRGIAARFRHALWVSALAICVALTLNSTLRLQPEPAPLPAHVSDAADLHVPVDSIQTAQSTPSGRQDLHGFTAPIVACNRILGLVLSALYGLLLIYRCARLSQAWHRTRALRRSARRIELSPSLARALERCRSIMGLRKLTVLASSRVAVPVTTGAFRPIVILPERLLGEADLPLLLSSLGHEAAHIARRDYLFNLLYEFISLPLWFHPAMRLVLRRIRQTRELRCDEIVTERLLEPRIYAQSLVQLAGAALPFGRSAATITVGIADADILEERIMRILKNSPARLGRRSALILTALLFVAPCLALAPFAVHVSIHQPAMPVAVQNPGAGPGNQAEAPSPQPLTLSTPDGEVTLTTTEPPKVGDVVRAGDRRFKVTAINREGRYIASALTSGENQKESQTSEAEARERAERKERREREEVELAARAQRRAELARLAKIPIDQAIQIAQRDTPGTVVDAQLIGERGGPMYLVSILPSDGEKTASLLINAVDGTIVRLKPKKEEQAR